MVVENNGKSFRLGKIAGWHEIKKGVQVLNLNTLTSFRKNFVDLILPVNHDLVGIVVLFRFEAYFIRFQ